MPRPTRRTFLARGLTLAGASALAPLAAATSDSDTEELAAVFWRAVRSGEVEAVTAALDRAPALLAVHDARGRSPFAVSLLRHHPAVGELLRGRGYVPDLHESALALDWPRFEELATAMPESLGTDHPLGSPMAAAARGGGADQMWRVYSQGVEPDARAGTCQPTPLVWAFSHPQLATAELTAATLLANGADPNLAQPGGQSALHAAATRGSLELVEMLLRKGARVDAVDQREKTPLELADEHGHRQVVELLERQAEIPRDCQNSRRANDLAGQPYRAPDLSTIPILRRSQLVGAAHFDLDEVRRQVGEEPRLVHAVATTTEGAVEACAHTGRLPIVDFLLDHGAPYSLPTAVVRGDMARVKALLVEDPRRIYERGAHDFALLWYPILGGGNLELAELLLDAGAEVEQQHMLGTTAMHFAARGGQIDMVRLLLERGGSPTRRGRRFDPAGQTPIEAAEQGGHAEVVALLRAAA